MTDDRIDRYARGDLTAPEARELAQASLEDPELFEDLTSSAVAKAAVSAPSARQQMERAQRSPRLIRYWTFAAAAAAAVIAGIYVSRPTPAPNPSSTLAPTLAISNAQPVLLASDLQSAQNGSAPVFRGQEAASRAPRQTGSIVSIEDGMASIDLGSGDGVAKGNELQILRDGQPAGLLTVTTVFRERARGRIPAGIQANASVRVSDTAYLAALMERIDGQFTQANVQNAVDWLTTAKVTPSEKRSALEKLAVLEYQAGALDQAEKHYQSAAEILKDAPPHEQSLVLNNLAVLHLLRRDYAGAEAPLAKAAAVPLTDIQYARSLNNLGVLAELIGERKKAEVFYGNALLAAFPEDRQAVKANLARVRGAR